MRAAARRLGILFAAATVSSAALSLLIGVALGAGVLRALSVGWYVAGSVTLLGGFFIASRGPARPQSDHGGFLGVGRWTRWATLEEQRESISLSVLVIVLGFVLVVLGALADPRYRFF